MTTRTTYHSFAELGLPDGMIVGNPIFVAQDEFTRNYHVVNADDFLRLCDDSWRKDPMIGVGFTGLTDSSAHTLVVKSIAQIKAPTR